ncbi:MAG: hypothetical protein V1755_05720 [Chloroflexota bacterium]
MPDQVIPAALARHPKLDELRPQFRPLVAAILADLEAQGYQPKISNAYRTAAQQAEKAKNGYSLTAKPGYHHWGLACDIVDQRWGWKVADDNAAFFRALRDACDVVGVASGGWWGLKPGRERHSPWLRWRLGWDVAHCQIIGAPRALRTDYGPGKR